MIMEKLFLPEEHYFLKAMQYIPVVYPASKAELVKLAADSGLTVRTDFDKFVPLSEILGGLAPETFDNFTHIRQAYLSAAAAKLKAAFNY